MEEKKRRLTRSNYKMIAGLCGGISEYFDWYPTLVRVGYVLLSIFTVFSGVIAYFVLWLIMPKEKEY